MNLAEISVLVLCKFINISLFHLASGHVMLHSCWLTRGCFFSYVRALITRCRQFLVSTPRFVVPAQTSFLDSRSIHPVISAAAFPLDGPMDISDLTVSKAVLQRQICATKSLPMSVFSNSKNSSA